MAAADVLAPLKAAPPQEKFAPEVSTTVAETSPTWWPAVGQRDVVI